MLEEFNIIIEPDDRWYVGGDYHLWHDKKEILNPRGFTDIHKYHEWLIKFHNERIRPQDNILFLGDFIIGAGSGNQARYKFDQLFNQLNGNWFMLFGNHNSVVKQIYLEELNKFWENLKIDNNNFYQEVYPITYRHHSYKNITFLGKFIEGIITIKPNNRNPHSQNYKYCASHYPIASWPQASKGAISISGHQHGKLNDWSPFELHKGKKLDCGVDNAIKYNNSPVFSIEEVIKIMNGKQMLKTVK